MPEKKAVVFCSASFDIDERFNDLARDVVRILFGCGYGMVSGGTNQRKRVFNFFFHN